jgi:UDP-N-acetylmuramoyl-L-alanyl-D-glutamate--2,6-diaminopimelate ligase
LCWGVRSGYYLCAHVVLTSPGSHPLRSRRSPMLLSDLLRHVSVLDVAGNVDRDVLEVTRDSREARVGSVFVAVRGASVDGHAYVASAVGEAVVVERDVPAPPGVTRIRVGDSRVALAEIAAALHGWPSRDVSVVGVTGTNGKTTVTTIVEQAWRAAGLACARVGTTGWSVDGEHRATAFTTPEAPELQALLAELRDRQIPRLAIEVSSIGLAQRRVEAVQFSTAVFTNLTRDHLDFHGTVEAYRDAKARLFTDLLRPAGGPPRALLCRDDLNWDHLGAPDDRWTYGFHPAADIRIDAVVPGPVGSRLQLTTPHGSTVIRTGLVGRYNAQNVAAALGVLLLHGLALVDAVRALEAVPGVPGRLEVVPNTRGLLVLVDYAHSDDALENVLTAVRELTDGAVWVVFGCGGDRDVSKRAPMGRVAARLADRIVVTSDNPRSEDPQRIIDGILRGVDGPALVEADRRAAIAIALQGAMPGDVVLIAGKGHETTQTVGSASLPFDDRAVARQILEAT